METGFNWRIRSEPQAFQIQWKTWAKISSIFLHLGLHQETCSRVGSSRSSQDSVSVSGQSPHLRKTMSRWSPQNPHSKTLLWFIHPWITAEAPDPCVGWHILQGLPADFFLIVGIRLKVVASSPHQAIRFTLEEWNTWLMRSRVTAKSGCSFSWLRTYSTIPTFQESMSDHVDVPCVLLRGEEKLLI